MSDFEVVADALNDLNYTVTSQSVEDTLKNNLEFSRLISTLTSQLSKLLNLEEIVNPIESSSEESTFNLELSSFLKELPCPYKNLTEGLLNERLSTINNRLDLIEYLTSEIQASRIISTNTPDLLRSTVTALSINETEETKALKTITTTLNLSKLPADITSKLMWQKIESQLIDILSKLAPNYLAKPLFTAELNDDQWTQLMHINKFLTDDFQMRRELLLTRLDVTIQSFKWAESMKKKNNEITSIYQKYRKQLPVRPNIKIYKILSARDDLLKQEKTCSTRIMTKSHLHKIIIPQPPDRGGRTNEMQAPPGEMPAFSQRRHSNNPQNQRQQQKGTQFFFFFF